MRNTLSTKLRASLRYRPNVMIIGAQKGGTTSFHWNLMRHPHVITARNKEPHFYDWNYNRGFDWYRRCYPLKTDLKFAQHTCAVCEATPDYLYYPFVPELIARDYPDMRFIVLLRDPVNRAVSNYEMEKSRRKLPMAAADVLSEELTFLKEADGEIDEAFYDRCFYSWIQNENSTYAKHHRRTRGIPHPALLQTAETGYTMDFYLLRGLYVIQLEKWFAHFPRENFLILRSEDYFSNPMSVIESVAKDFLQLKDWSIAHYEEKFQNFKYDKLDPDLTQALRAFFAPYNERLYDLVGTNFDW